MEPIRTDALVIGSGFGAAAPALRLAQAGLRVHVVEKGPAIGPEGFRQTQDPRYLTRYLKGLSSAHLNLTYAEALGGGSGFYEMVSLRAPSLAFNQRDGGRRLWPEELDREAFDPWYDQAEAMLRVEQIGEDEIPKSGLVFALLMKNLGLSCDRARYAVRNCLGSGYCVTGCIYGAKQSLHVNYLPQAVEAGATIDCDLEAIAIEPLGHPERSGQVRSVAGLPYRYEVLCRKTDGSRRELRYQARFVFLGGGTVGTAALLLRSRPHLPLLSPQVGKRVAFNGSVKVVGLLPDHFPDGDMFTGRSHPGMISYHFLESHGVTVTAGKALPVLAVAGARFHVEGSQGQPTWWGAPHAELMRKYRHRMVALVSFGLTLPGGSISLADDGTPRLELDRTPELQRYVRETRALLESILTRNECRLVRTEWIEGSGMPHAGLYLSTAHQTGSARMADRPADGVVDPAGEVFGYPGLYVSDGAAIPSSLAVNTSLTILANAERVAAGLLNRYGLGNQGKKELVRATYSR
jgi:enediyne biosynthesis protein E9